MACEITTGIARGCGDNAGGIVEIYLGNYPTGYTSTEWYDVVDGTITGTTGLSVYSYIPTKNSSEWSEEIQSAVAAGTTGYEQAISLFIPKNEASKRNQIYILGQANMIAIVRDKNEKYWLLGAQDGVELTGGSSNSGVGLNDPNGWTLNFTGMEPQPAFEVEAAEISNIFQD